MYATVPTQAHRLARGVLHCLHTGGAIGVPISFEYNLIQYCKILPIHSISCVESCVNNPVFNIWQSPPISSDFRVHSVYFENKARPHQITSIPMCIYV